MLNRMERGRRSASPDVAGRVMRIPCRHAQSRNGKQAAMMPCWTTTIYRYTMHTVCEHMQIYGNSFTYSHKVRFRPGTAAKMREGASRGCSSAPQRDSSATTVSWRIRSNRQAPCRAARTDERFSPPLVMAGLADCGILLTIFHCMQEGGTQ